MRLLHVPLVLSMASGCRYLAMRSLDAFCETHGLLTEADAGNLSGPFSCEEIMLPTTVSIVRDGARTVIGLRGCRSTGIAEMDWECTRTLTLATSTGMGPRTLYLRDDSTARGADGRLTSVIYCAANRIFAGEDDQGNHQFDVLTYTAPQLSVIAFGYCLVDHADTDYPLYDVFRQMENLAKRAREGYWATVEVPSAGD